VTASGSSNTSVLERSGKHRNSPNAYDNAWSDTEWFNPQYSGRHSTSGTLLQASPVAVGNAFSVTTEDVIDVLGPDADSLLADSKLEMGELVQLLNAETMLLPRIDAEMEAEIESALAGDPELKKTKGAHAKAATGVWKKRFLKAAIGAVLVTAAGGGTAFAMNKSVTMEVDGQTQSVNTFSGTVRDVVQSEGMNIGPHDILSPSPDAQVSDGGKIVLDRGRQLSVTVDGVRQSHWVHSGSLGEALQQLKINTKNAWMSDSPNAQVPVSGENVDVKTLKHITVADGAGHPKAMQTHAVTVGELMRSMNIKLGKEDKVSPSANEKITDGKRVTISRTGTQVVNTKRSIAPPEKKVDDSSMTQGETKVVDEGKAGSEMVTSRVTSVNGKVEKTVELAVKQLTAPQPKITHVGTKPKPAANAANGSLWDEIAACESSGNWAMDSGNGYYGGLQFDRGTWLSNGGGQYGETANLATREQQITIANKVKAERGLQPWQCAGELGLR
jgi:uncharacterized protein YabE (DUF348 family)